MPDLLDSGSQLRSTTTIPGVVPQGEGTITFVAAGGYKLSFA